MAAVMYLCALLTVLALTPATLGQGDSCQACNCQFNNVEVLDQLIESKIRNLLANNSGMWGYFVVCVCVCVSDRLHLFICCSFSVSKTETTIS